MVVAVAIEVEEIEQVGSGRFAKPDRRCWNKGQAGTIRRLLRIVADLQGEGVHPYSDQPASGGREKS